MTDSREHRIGAARAGKLPVPNTTTGAVVRHVFTGSTLVMVGVVLWLTTGGITVPVLSWLPQLGMVLILLGFLEFLWGAWRMFKRPGR